MAAENGTDFCGLDPDSANLHLIVIASKKSYRTVGAIVASVPG